MTPNSSGSAPGKHPSLVVVTLNSTSVVTDIFARYPPEITRVPLSSSKLEKPLGGVLDQAEIFEFTIVLH